jgi:hypothetical protein
MGPSPSETLLSPYGEGYCRVCRFVVGLGPSGLLVPHMRGVGVAWEPKPCKGSATVPPKVTPYASRKSAFRVTAPTRWCPTCEQDIPVMEYSGLLRRARHLTKGKPRSVCVGTLEVVTE